MLLPSEEGRRACFISISTDPKLFMCDTHGRKYVPLGEHEFDERDFAHITGMVRRTALIDITKQWY